MSPKASLGVTPPVLTVANVDYAAARTQTIADLNAALLATNGADTDRKAALQAQITFITNAPAVTVTYYASIPVRCSGKNCPTPSFLASFPATQRTLVCPTCGRENEVPSANRESP